MGDLKNAATDAVGRAKEAVGDATGDQDLKTDGQLDQVGATVRSAAEDVKDKASKVVGDAADKANDMLKGDSE